MSHMCSQLVLIAKIVLKHHSEGLDKVLVQFPHNDEINGNIIIWVWGKLVWVWVTHFGVYPNPIYIDD